MDQLRVNFVSNASVALASHRLRMLKPAELINTKTNKKIAATVTPQTQANGVHVNVYFKHLDPAANLTGVHSGPDLGYYSVFDICDDHFDRELGKYYEAMCEKADAITCNSANMQTRIFDVTGKLARIIPDPISFPHGTPYHSVKPKLLWFGHSSNAKPLFHWVQQLPEDVRVTAICDMSVNHPQVDYVPWRPMMAESRIKSSDIVLIPSTDMPWTKCKSPNRAVDALSAGKFVIVDNEEIYGELKDFVYFIKSPEELPKALEWYSKNPTRVVEMIKAGQEFIKQRYSDQVILNQWLAVFKDLGVLV
jgi:glycosyltransferase involved in cell wall biosynthesis